jgi:hypothetical protein
MMKTRFIRKRFCTAFLTVFFAANITAFSALTSATPAPLVSIETHDNFFNAIKAHCGKAFIGKVSKDNVGNTFGGEQLIMHVRECSDTQLHIPFHVGDDASRTWIVTKTGSGLMLKHDHRNKDGSFHTSTMYGGHTDSRGYSEVQSFPADAYSKQLFIDSGINASTDNVWQMMIYPERFSYRLVRPAREVQVDFDLTKPVDLPKTPWGYTPLR